MQYGENMQTNEDIYELNLLLLTEAARMAAIKPQDAMEKYGIDRETCSRLSMLSDEEISRVSKTNIALFLAAIGLNHKGDEHVVQH